MRRFLLCLALCLLPAGATAQGDAAETERDRDFITAFLEDNLSSLGRSVRIEGFRGALSSRATFDELTIADAEGVWITIRDGAIGWNRAAILSGRVEIREMVAAEIDLPRAPMAGGPSAEASGFSLPELPVSVDIGALRADRVVLGEALFGAPTVVRLDGRLHLEGGEGTASLSITRTDGTRGMLALTGSYANATRKATLDLLLDEAEGGIAANLLGLPDRPSVQLAVHGDGVIDDLVTDIALSTAGASRLSGTVTLKTTGAPGADAERSFAADIRGDIAPLLLPDYRTFFGTDVTLQAEGRRLPSGQLDLARFVLGSQGLDLSGRLSLAPGGLPLQAALTARIGLVGGGDVLLPLPGPRTHVSAGDIRLRYDHVRGDSWTLEGVLHGFRREGIRIGEMTLGGSGRIAGAGAADVRKARIGGTLTFAANEVAPADPGLAAAVGPEVSGRTIFSWQEGEPLRLPLLEVTGQGYAARGNVTVSEPASGVTVAGRIDAKVADMGRFSGLAGRSIGGSGALSLSGSTGLLSGRFDIEGSVTGRGLALDQPELDRLLSGDSRIVLSAVRDETGIGLRRLELRAATLSAVASGRIATGASDLQASLDFSKLSDFGPNYRGALKGEARLTEAGGTRRITFDAIGGGLGIGQREIDRLLAGEVKLVMAATERGGRMRLESLDLTNPQVSISAKGELESGARRVELSARLSDMALIAPGFPGPVTARGLLSEAAEGFALDLGGEGPGAVNARVTGTVAPDFSTGALSVKGGGQAAVINPFIEPRNVAGPVAFDFRLDGPFRLSSLAGRATLEGGRLVAPTFGIELENLQLAANVSGGTAALSGAASVRGGGGVELSGSLALTSPYPGDLAIRLSAARLRDPELFDTTVTGTVRVNGPLLGGAVIGGDVTLGRTEVRVPSTGIGADPVLHELAHVREPADVRRTRERAGLTRMRPGEARRVVSYGLNLNISAQERIFVRGRGLDVEMGGSLGLSGATDNIVPSGRFGLIRGRLDLLGKRFTIDEGSIELQGALTPYVRFLAQSQSDGVTAMILIEGEVVAPEIRFRSSPELPEEEVLARLLFGRGLDKLSALQAAQLAGAVAELAGSGGGGIVSRLRNSFGLDDLDVTSDETGSATVRAGKYLSEKVYTDVTLGAEGKTEININLDVRPGVVARGTLGSDGSTGVGVYYERDY